MKAKIQTQQVLSVPAVFITKDKQRVKQYNSDTVFLNNGEEFEIELFNPTSNKVLAKIKLNGNYLGSGIVLRPGERVFLERYFDEAKKFIFETYQVDANDPVALRAIENNGIVTVEFYEERKNYNCSINYYNNYTWVPKIITYTGGSYVYYGSDSNISAKAFNSNDSVSSSFFGCCNQVNEPTMKETGRIEKGSYSNQSFVDDYTSFNSTYSWWQTWTILPKSQKPLAKEDIKIFCVNCGSRRKKDSFQYCPHCGNKF